jgi:hypothetical protein
MFPRRFKTKLFHGKEEAFLRACKDWFPIAVFPSK